MQLVEVWIRFVCRIVQELFQVDLERELVTVINLAKTRVTLRRQRSIGDVALPWPWRLVECHTRSAWVVDGGLVGMTGKSHPSLHLEGRDLLPGIYSRLPTFLRRHNLGMIPEGSSSLWHSIGYLSKGVNLLPALIKNQPTIKLFTPGRFKIDINASNIAFHLPDKKLINSTLGCRVLAEKLGDTVVRVSSRHVPSFWTRACPAKPCWTPVRHAAWMSPGISTQTTLLVHSFLERPFSAKAFKKRISYIPTGWSDVWSP